MVIYVRYFGIQFNLKVIHYVDLYVAPYWGLIVLYVQILLDNWLYLLLLHQNPLENQLVLY